MMGNAYDRVGPVNQPLCMLETEPALPGRLVFVQAIQVMNSEQDLYSFIRHGQDTARLERCMPYGTIPEKGFEELVMPFLLNDAVGGVPKTVPLLRRNIEGKRVATLFSQVAID